VKGVNTHGFWSDRLPHLSEGIFATYWTLNHAIKTSPGGIAEPKQIVVLENNKDNKPTCRELTKEETDPIEQAVNEAESRLTAINKPSANAEDIPKPSGTQPASPAKPAEKSFMEISAGDSPQK